MAVSVSTAPCCSSASATASTSASTGVCHLAVSVTLSNREILLNSGPAQLMSTFKVHMDAAETELKDRFVEDLHSAGAEYQQISGLQMAVPTTPTNTYGGIDRNAYPIWRTTTYDANSITAAGTGCAAALDAERYLATLADAVEIEKAHARGEEPVPTA